MTTWIYDSQRGWLNAKRDAASQGADYTYDPAGRLSTREWARVLPGTTTRLKTTYGYDAGKLTSATYNDNLTPNVSYTYDAFGRQSNIVQNGNSWTYTYDPATLALDQEIITYDTDHDGTGDFTRTLDRSQDAKLRNSGYQLKNGTSIEASAALTYDPAGRLHTISDGTDTFTYGYQAASYTLLKTITGPALTVTNDWETTRDVLLAKENKAGATVISRYGYSVNELGQRTALQSSGSTFAAARTIDWGYNPRGEVTAAAHTDPAQSRFYEYDPIGNRKKSRTGTPTDSGGQLVNYTANALNQYTAIAPPELQPSRPPTTPMATNSADPSPQAPPKPSATSGTEKTA